MIRFACAKCHIYVGALDISTTASASVKFTCNVCGGTQIGIVENYWWQKIKAIILGRTVRVATRVGTHKYGME